MKISLPAAVPCSQAPDLSTTCDASAEVQAAAGKFRVSRLALTSGASQGVELLVVDSGRVRAAICPTRGMGLWKANIDAQPLEWKSPVQGPVHPSHVPIFDPGGLGWLEGFDELLVRCGLNSFGAPQMAGNGSLEFPLHGRIANLPAGEVEISLDEENSRLEVSGVVHETRFLQYDLQLTARYVFPWGEPSIEVHDTVTNGSSQPQAAQMLYHINVGSPLLGEGATFHTGSARAVARDARAVEDIATWDTYRGPTPGYAEQVYFFASQPQNDGWATNLLASADGQRGFALHAVSDTLPYFSQWKNTVDQSDGYVTGFEPGTGFPNPRSFEQSKGRLVQLAGGESIDFQLKLEGINQASRVAELVKQLSDLRGDIQLDEFDASWCTGR